MIDELPVALHGDELGSLGRARDQRQASLHWSPAAESRYGLNSSVLSRNLRVGARGPATIAATESFFGGLLPEGRHLDRLAAQVKAASNDLVALFAAVGADVAGALRVGDEREHTEPELLTETEILALLDRADGFLVGGGGSALPGFQRKLTLTRRDGRWLRGNGSVASTHILKPVNAENRASVEAEKYALLIAGRLGLAEYEVTTETIGDRAVLIVERYDRRRTPSGEIERLHQEDAAQALGLPWGGNEKFEANDARASHRAFAALLDDARTVFDPDQYADRRRLLQMVTLNVAVGNTDGHAKNFGLLRAADGTDRLAPAYDIAPLALDFASTNALAMFVNGKRQQPDVTADDLVAEAATWGVPEGVAQSTVDETLDAIIEATRVLPAHDSIAAHVPGYVRQQATNLAAGNLRASCRSSP